EWQSLFAEYLYQVFLVQRVAPVDRGGQRLEPFDELGTIFRHAFRAPRIDADDTLAYRVGAAQDHAADVAMFSNQLETDAWRVVECIQRLPAYLGFVVDQFDHL